EGNQASARVLVSDVKQEGPQERKICENHRLAPAAPAALRPSLPARPRIENAEARGGPRRRRHERTDRYEALRPARSRRASARSGVRPTKNGWCRGEKPPPPKPPRARAAGSTSTASSKRAIR